MGWGGAGRSCEQCSFPGLPHTDSVDSSRKGPKNQDFEQGFRVILMQVV